MHELSIALSMIEMATEEAARRGQSPCDTPQVGTAFGRGQGSSLVLLRSRLSRHAARRFAVGDRGSSSHGLLSDVRCGNVGRFHSTLLLSGLRHSDIASLTGAGTRSRRFGDTRMNTQPRLVEVRQKVLKQNDLLARELRRRFREAGVYVVSLVSSPGSGKTAFLEIMLSRLRLSCRVAALVGDLATDNDAARLARSRVPVKQIMTGTICHLDAAMVENALDDWNLDELDPSVHRKRRQPRLSFEL